MHIPHQLVHVCKEQGPLELQSAVREGMSKDASRARMVVEAAIDDVGFLGHSQASTSSLEELTSGTRTPDGLL